MVDNISFSSGTLRTTLKTANVIPILKKDHIICNDYRSISLQSNISKIIEKLIHSKLTFFLTKNNVFHKKKLDSDAIVP